MCCAIQNANERSDRVSGLEARTKETKEGSLSRPLDDMDIEVPSTYCTGETLVGVDTKVWAVMPQQETQRK